jgi:hypothetical protein
LWRDRDALREAVRAEALCAARFEPIVRRGRDEAMLDLTFARGDGYVVVPAVVVPTRFVALRESEPLIWPAEVAAALEEDAADAVRDRLLPWLGEVLIGREAQGERFAVFATAHEAAWLQAREADFLGAAPAARAWSVLAPFLYAQRFARERVATIAARTAPAGYAAVARVARRVHLPEIDAAAGAAAQRWFGAVYRAEDDPQAELILADAVRRESFAERGARRVWIGAGAPGRAVTAPAAVPFDAAFAFTRGRGPVAAILTVEPDEVPPPAPAAAPVRPGSSGRILLAVRPDAQTVPDGDLDEARALHGLLRGDGFDVTLGLQAADVAGHDLVHVIGLHAPQAARAVLAAARAARIRTIVTPQLEDIAKEGYWGSEVGTACFALRSEEAGVRMMLDLLAQRRLASATVNAASGPPDDYVAAVRDALAMADAAVVASPGEERLLRDRYGYQGPIELVAPFLPADAPAPVRWAAGDGPFALLLAPLEPKSNALAGLRAADQAGLRLVVAGPAADAAYVALLREHACDEGTIVEDPGPDLEAGLLAAARVYLDCSWISRGVGRIVRAAAAGCAVVASARGWGAELLAPSLDSADPADVASIAAALRAAWGRADAANPLAQRAQALSSSRPALDRLLALYARVAGQPVS